MAQDPFCPRPGFQKTGKGRAFGQFPNALPGKELHQELRQSECRKSSKTHLDSDLSSRNKGTSYATPALPSERSDLTQQILKDAYSFEFLTLSSSAKERELERGLLKHLRDLLLDLGCGFAFVGSQVQLEVDGQPFYVDLLFYHLRLHCYFVIELKSGPFKPKHAGKLSFYLSAVDAMMRTPVDGPSLGEPKWPGRRVHATKHRPADRGFDLSCYPRAPRNSASGDFLHRRPAGGDRKAKKGIDRGSSVI